MQSLLQFTEVSARLHRNVAGFTIQLQDAIHVPWENHNNAASNGGAVLIGSHTARRNRNSPPPLGKLPSKACGFANIVFIARINYYRWCQSKHAGISSVIPANVRRDYDLA